MGTVAYSADGGVGTGGRHGVRFVHALALGVDPAWSRLPSVDRWRSAREFASACAAGGDVTTLTYAAAGLGTGVDFLLWSSGPSPEALEERAAAVLRSGLGAWTAVRDCFAGRLAPVSPEESEADYLVVYPFVKTADWYGLSHEARQATMYEHMRVGHRFPQVRQRLATSLGVGDHEHVVACETDDLAAFHGLVGALRRTERRRATSGDTLVLATVRREPEEIADLLVA